MNTKMFALPLNVQQRYALSQLVCMVVAVVMYIWGDPVGLFWAGFVGLVSFLLYWRMVHNHPWAFMFFAAIFSGMIILPIGLLIAFKALGVGPVQAIADSVTIWWLFIWFAITINEGDKEVR